MPSNTVESAERVLAVMSPAEAPELAHKPHLMTYADETVVTLTKLLQKVPVPPYTTSNWAAGSLTKPATWPSST